MSRNCRSPKAFTLFEMLVVISLILILISMLLPAVQQVRESARRLNCQHNQLQLATAARHYETSHECLPPGVINDNGPVTNDELGRDISFLLILLPFLEQGSVTENFDFEAGAYAPENEEIRNLNFYFFRCSSDAAKPGDNNYVGCHHHIEAPIDKNNQGLLFLNSAIRDREIQDGRAHTILIGEKTFSEFESLGWLSGTSATLRNTGSFESWSSQKQANPVNATAESPDELFVGGFSSRHPTGCNFAFADGSLHLIIYSIDPFVLQNLGHRADGAMMHAW